MHVYQDCTKNQLPTDYRSGSGVWNDSEKQSALQQSFMCGDGFTATTKQQLVSCLFLHLREET